LASNPDIITIMLGTNDAKGFNWFGVQQQGDSYVDDYLTMIQTLQALPSHPKIFVMTLVPSYHPAPFQMNETVINDIISPVPNGLVSMIAERTGVSLIDIHSVFVSGGYDHTITCDNRHPNDDGYRLIAAAMTPILRAAATDLRLALATSKKFMDDDASV
jgi:lysophospholipase L1-like esterase